MKKSSDYVRVLKAVRNFLFFFLLTAFIVTCCTTMFLTLLSRSLGIEFTRENLTVAAKLTFINVVLLSLLFTVFDAVRRKLTLGRQVKLISDAAERLMRGDFSARIEPLKGTMYDERFDEIIECFNKMAEELSGLESLRTDFIANVSHEMKTPLSVIKNYGRLLQSEGLDERTRMEYSRAITDASQRLSEMITNILKLNKLENQQIYPSSREYDLSEQLCRCLLQFENVWESRGIEIDTDIDEGVTVCADPELLTLVWNNLLSNAFKFTDRGGCVSVSLKDDGDSVTVSVSDTGCGMTAEVGAHIFEKFYQGDASRASLGNGLGLALVKRVVDIVEGEISVESTPLVGSSFKVKIRRNGNEKISV